MRGRQLRPGLQEVLEVGRGEDQHLAGPVAAVAVVAVAGLRHAGPTCEVIALAASGCWVNRL